MMSKLKLVTMRARSKALNLVRVLEPEAAGRRRIIEVAVGEVGIGCEHADERDEESRLELIGQDALLRGQHVLPIPVVAVGSRLG
eukprot:scaffold329223_cov149-Tisochrysis_lutea.AAC.1